MQENPDIKRPGSDETPRVCVVSLRHAERNLSRCVGYEFEDVVCRIDDADIYFLEPTFSHRFSKRAANRLTKLGLPAGLFNPGLRTVRIQKQYDICLVMCQLISDLFSLNRIKALQAHCGVSVCWLEEAWAGELHKYRRHLKLLERFDYLFTGCSQSAEALQERVQRPCSYLPPGVDALRFCPYPNPPVRSIDVYNMGRRSPVTHAALLELAREQDFFYVYDTLLRLETLYPNEHRDLIANLCKRSKFFIANAAKIDLVGETQGQGEVGYRFFEGAASGAVMLGSPPNNAHFKRLFPWPDAVIRTPFDCPEVASILITLDTQTERLERMRTAGIAHSLRHHDWAHRWQTILETIGLPLHQRHTERVGRLRKLAAEVEKVSTPPVGPSLRAS